MYTCVGAGRVHVHWGDEPWAVQRAGDPCVGGHDTAQRGNKCII